MNDATPIGATEASPIKKGRKFDQVLEGARAVFTADGFEGASVDAIAKAAGVSKATLYSYFPDKRLLFIECAKAECCQQIDAAEGIMVDGADPRAVLSQIGHRMLDLVLSEFGQAIFRLCVAESERFPELGREFFASGPEVMHGQMCAYLRGAVETGDLAIDDVELAAHQFIELCHAHLFTEMVFGLRTKSSKAEVERVVDGAVATFMARYGA